VADPEAREKLVKRDTRQWAPIQCPELRLDETASGQATPNRI